MSGGKQVGEPTIKRFHIRSAAKRRGGILPARLRFSAHRGVTLVELMIAMLILALVCTAWLEIIGIQSARKEARRREAVERLAGMMDAFIEVFKTGKESTTKKGVNTGCYRMVKEGGRLYFEPDSTKKAVYSIYEDGASPIGYQLRVVNKSDALVGGMSSDWGSRKWLVGRLYDSNGGEDNVGKPFFVLPVCLGF